MDEAETERKQLSDFIIILQNNIDSFQNGKRTPTAKSPPPAANSPVNPYPSITSLNAKAAYSDYEKSIRNQRQSRDLTFKYERMNSELNLLNSTYQDKFARMTRQMKTHRRHLYSLITRTDTLTQSNDKLEQGETKDSRPASSGIVTICIQ